ncbi:DUF4158 domain-containing protein (plasmid) [Streptomyces sp. NBC_00289]|uniref:hypothetical protein n=1 Tax=Streptomyces sp. NBC_00289 TaxID=2975703 RepID=UPI002F913643
MAFLTDEQRRSYGTFTAVPDDGQLAGYFLLDGSYSYAPGGPSIASSSAAWSARSPTPSRPWQR